MNTRYPNLETQSHTSEAFTETAHIGQGYLLPHAVQMKIRDTQRQRTERQTRLLYRETVQVKIKNPV